MTTLRGITWAHSRGYVPLVAAAEAWHDLDPDIEILWDKRSLWGFGEGPLDEVVRNYDLIVFDHPFTGRAAARRLFLPLDEHLPAEWLASCAADSVGPSYRSYSFAGHQYGLPVDAAFQTAVCQPSLDPPPTWDGVLELARGTGRVRCAFSPMGTAGMFHTLCAGMGAPAGQQPGVPYVEPDAASSALHMLRDLFIACGREGLDSSPVRILAEMATDGGTLYCPLVYCYSNYARQGFTPRTLKFLPAPTHPQGHGAILGGAGLAVSAFTRNRAAALAFAAWCCSAECQSSLYLASGGQPGRRSAWESITAQHLAPDFFSSLLPALDRAYVRPTYAGFTDFQSRLGEAIHAFLLEKAGVAATLSSIDRDYHESRISLSA